MEILLADDRPLLDVHLRGYGSLKLEFRGGNGRLDEQGFLTRRALHQADVAHHALETGHAVSAEDRALARGWLGRFGGDQFRQQGVNR